MCCSFLGMRKWVRAWGWRWPVGNWNVPKYVLGHWATRLKCTRSVLIIRDPQASILSFVGCDRKSYFPLNRQKRIPSKKRTPEKEARQKYSNGVAYFSGISCVHLRYHAVWEISHICIDTLRCGIHRMTCPVLFLTAYKGERY